MERTRTRRWTALALTIGLTLGSTGIVGLGGSVGAAGTLEASASAFCHTLETFHPHAPVNPKNAGAYAAFAKSELPTFEALERTAPSKAVHDVFASLVLILKFYAAHQKISALYTKFETAHARYWVTDWKAFYSAIMSCVGANLG